MKYPVSSRMFDAKRSKKDWTAQQLKLYIGRQSIHLLVADDLYRVDTGQTILSPAMRMALKQVRDHALRGNTNG